jgi:hypothetical protein
MVAAMAADLVRVPAVVQVRVQVAEVLRRAVILAELRLLRLQPRLQPLHPRLRPLRLLHRSLHLHLHPRLRPLRLLHRSLHLHPLQPLRRNPLLLQPLRRSLHLHLLRPHRRRKNHYSRPVLTGLLFPHGKSARLQPPNLHLLRLPRRSLRPHPLRLLHLNLHPHQHLLQPLRRSLHLHLNPLRLLHPYRRLLSRSLRKIPDALNRGMSMTMR